MSQQLIGRSPDLKRLRDEGYDVVVRDSYLLVRNIPYVTANLEIKRGTLVDPLTLSGGVTARPTDHTVMFSGEYPCGSGGQPLKKIVNSSQRRELAEGLEIDHMFSSKPGGGYADYYEKITTYAAILTSEVRAIDPTVTPRVFPLVENKEEDDSPFVYVDTASSRAGIGAIGAKLAQDRVAIVGLGGTGAYILDLVAKTPVGEIHLFDGDTFMQHNAFRAPGAPANDELREASRKVDYWAGIYSKMHRNVVPHPYFVDESNVHELTGMDFVFVALDPGPHRQLIVKTLNEADLQFIDVGVGVYEVGGALAGHVRTTTRTQDRSDHIWDRISTSWNGGNDDYARNIQIADLNSLNATLAVIKWKKLRGFYNDLENEHHSTYTIDGNVITNEDKE